MPKPKSAAAPRKRSRDLDARALAMLERYDCPMPFHAVCTYFLGAIAATGPVQPMKALARLWGGRLPAMPSIDAVNELLGVLISGLWNALTVHQDPGHPYPLMAFPAQTTRESLACVAECAPRKSTDSCAVCSGTRRASRCPGRWGNRWTP